MAKEVVTPIQKRFSDADMFRHINNAAQQLYYDLGKTDLFARLIALPTPSLSISPVTVAISNNFYSQIHYEEAVEVHTSIIKLGNRSLTLFQQIVACDNGEIKGDSTTVMVAFDPVTQLSVELPLEWRTAFGEIE